MTSAQAQPTEADLPILEARFSVRRARFILGLGERGPLPSLAEISRSYRKKAFLLHPDRVVPELLARGHSHNVNIQDLNHAKEILTYKLDPELAKKLIEYTDSDDDEDPVADMGWRAYSAYAENFNGDDPDQEKKKRGPKPKPQKPPRQGELRLKKADLTCINGTYLCPQCDPGKQNFMLFKCLTPHLKNQHRWSKVIWEDSKMGRPRKRKDDGNGNIPAPPTRLDNLHKKVKKRMKDTTPSYPSEADKWRLVDGEGGVIVDTDDKPLPRGPVDSWT